MSEQENLILGTIRDETETLKGIIRSYVLKMGLASAAEAENSTEEILNETVIAALEAAETFDTSRRPIPWLLGIAIKRIQRALSNKKRRNEREIAIRDLYPHDENQESDDELFERFAAWADAPHDFETEETVRTLLAPLSEADRNLLQRAIIQELDMQSLAADLGISPTALRVRLHRALKRLRGQFQLQEAIRYED